MASNKILQTEKGSIIVTILIVMVFLSSLLLGLLLFGKSSMIRAHNRIMLLQAQYAAESGADSAIAVLNSGNDAYVGTPSDVTLLSGNYKATYSVAVANGSSGKERIITATGKVYNPSTRSTPNHTRSIRVTAQRSSTTTASSIVSRNIISLGSGVKNVVGRDVYVNGFIEMNKNTTNLIAENITVAGKKTGAGNCSIGGTGNLLKPGSFTDPLQTKTKIRTAYNNCITPPGNTTNANFDVLANQGNISQIQSMYIPWSQYMDGTYGNAGSCTDWTTGGSTRNIPSASGSKLTHYPDSGSNISASCGTSGDLALGSNRYNINASTHIRANLCAASACNPTFYNPDSGAAGIKYVFVEGTINFDSIQTIAGSGPIIFINYGADPASKAAVCPYGGAVYLGNSGSTSASAAFFLATNGLCIDKTKFGSTPALGGMAAKNLYIASNPGTPFDLALDPNFPVSQIPIDLAWREVYYERL